MPVSRVTDEEIDELKADLADARKALLWFDEHTSFSCTCLANLIDQRAPVEVAIQKAHAALSAGKDSA